MILGAQNQVRSNHPVGATEKDQTQRLDASRPMDRLGRVDPRRTRIRAGSDVMPLDLVMCDGRCGSPIRRVLKLDCMKNWKPP